MKFPSREIVERVRREYPAGTRVELVRMDDAQAPLAGTLGTVLGVDDTGSDVYKRQPLGFNTPNRSRMICSCQSISSKGFPAQVPLVWQRDSMNMTA